MGTGGSSERGFAIQNWSRSNRRSHRRTPWASGASCLQSKASTTLSLACAPTAPNSSARWPSTRTSTDSVTCEALRATSSRWPRNSSEAFTAFGETDGALGAPSTRSHGSQPSCFLAYLRRGFVRRTKTEAVSRGPLRQFTEHPLPSPEVLWPPVPDAAKHGAKLLTGFNQL